MKIKTTKKLNLPELIQYVIDKGWNSYQVTSDNKVDVYFSYSNNFVICDNSSISLDDTFTVEVEEDLKMSTKLPFMVHMYIDADGKERSENCYNQSIVECRFPVECEEISLTMYSASGGDLTFIWSGRNGIPESGVVGVDTE